MVSSSENPIPVPLVKEEKPLLPGVAFALGMAAAYYAYPLFGSFSSEGSLLTALFFIFAIVICLLRVLSSLPWEKAPNQILVINILAAAAILGFFLGIGCRLSVKDRPEIGLLPEKVIAVSGVLKEDPRTLQGGSGIAGLELKQCSGEGGVRASAGGNLTVFFNAESIPRLKEFGRGCEIYAEGILTRGERGLLFSAASVHITKPAPKIEQFRTGLRITLLDKFQSRGGTINIWGSLASALLLGVRDDLDMDLSNGFRNSGCSHILALSGMHLAIISGLLAFCLKRPLGKRRASLAGAVFIIFYVFIAGSQPSLVRAAIMYLLGTIAVWGFLKTIPIALLAMAFIIQLLFQSETGLSYSFILSYLALAGILTLGETIRALLRGRLPVFFAGAFSASLGAFAVTSPVIVLFFGSLHPIGIAAGIILAPLSSLFMIISVFALAASFISLPLWSVFDFILTSLYRLIEFLVSFAGNIPGISFSNAVVVLVIFLLFWLLMIFLRKQDMKRRDSIASFD